MLIYENNAEIVSFLGKAKAKIAELGSESIVSDSDRGVNLAIELKKVIRTIESAFLDWSERDVLKAVHYYTHKAKLANIPYFAFPGFVTVVSSPSGPVTNLPAKIHAADVVDFNAAVALAVKAALHNTLAGLDGPGTFHLTQAEKDYIVNLVNPFQAPAVSLSGSKASNILYKKLINISPITLTGSINLNQGGSVTAKRFYIGDTLLASDVDSVEYTQPLKDTTTFRFEADFAKGGTKSASVTYNFALPIIYGLVNSGVPSTELVTGKVSDVEIQFGFIDPDKGPFVRVPIEMGEVKKIEIAGFDTLAGGANWDVYTSGLFTYYQFLGDYNEAFKIKLIW